MTAQFLCLITDEDDREYRDLTQDFLDWCQWNHLQMNTGKTKVQVVDFHRRNLIKKGQLCLGMPPRLSAGGGMITKPLSLMENGSHPMQDTLRALESSFSGRLLHPKCVKERYRRPFLPAAVRPHNQHCSQQTPHTHQNRLQTEQSHCPDGQFLHLNVFLIYIVYIISTFFFFFFTYIVYFFYLFITTVFSDALYFCYPIYCCNNAIFPPTGLIKKCYVMLSTQTVTQT